jgi:hemolysin III
MEFRIKILKDPWAFATHFAGLAFAIAGLVLLVVWSDGAAKVTAMSIYGASLVVLFGASAAYHFFDIGERGNAVLQRIDHAAIFFLIAGSYLPPLILLLDGACRITMISVVSGLAVLGILFKVIWFRCPVWLSTGLYVSLGWIVIIPAYRMFPQLGAAQLGWLIAGGLAYTLGALVFVFERPNPFPATFGHHEVWHVMVLLGAMSHWIFAFRMVPFEYVPF